MIVFSKTNSSSQLQYLKYITKTKQTSNQNSKDFVMATNITKTFRRSFATTVIRNQLKDVVIVGAARTPMGSFRGYVTAIIFLTRASIIVFQLF